MIDRETDAFDACMIGGYLCDGDTDEFVARVLALHQQMAESSDKLAPVVRAIASIMHRVEALASELE